MWIRARGAMAAAVGAIAWVLINAGPVAAQQATLQDDLLDRLVGRWTLTGTITGKQTTHDVNAEWVLNHQYLQVREVSRERDQEGRPQYDATVFIGWDEARRGYVCFWLDVFGGGFAGTGFAERQPNRLPFFFGDKDRAFHTTLLFDRAADSWEWQMDSEQRGRREPFARLTLTRA
jgi:hypothetical protein